MASLLTIKGTIKSDCYKRVQPPGEVFYARALYMSSIIDYVRGSLRIGLLEAASLSACYMQLVCFWGALMFKPIVYLTLFLTLFSLTGAASAQEAKLNISSIDQKLEIFSSTFGCYAHEVRGKLFVKLGAVRNGKRKVTVVKLNSISKQIKQLKKLKSRGGNLRRINAQLKSLAKQLELANRCLFGQVTPTATPTAVPTLIPTPFPTPSSTPTPTPTLSEFFTISRHGITWEGRTADGSFVQQGVFANGDPWIKGDVLITGITPQSLSIGGRDINGSMLDPNCTDDIGFGRDLIGFLPYSRNNNVAWGLSAAQPLSIVLGSANARSLISAESNSDTNIFTGIRKAAVLTVVKTVPAAGSFRPPYAAVLNKQVGFNVADLQDGLLPSLPALSEFPAISEVANKFEKLWYDARSNWPSRFVHPVESMPDFGRDLAAELGTGFMALIGNASLAQKRTLLIRMVQIGIDFFGNFQAGCRHSGNSGHGSGRKFPILFSGLMLSNPEMLSIGQFVSQFNPTLPQGEPQIATSYFGEDSQTFYVSETAPGEINYSLGGYSSFHVGLPEYGSSHTTYPGFDTPSWDADPNRRCCTANGWQGEALAARALGLISAWNNMAFFDYMDRYMVVQGPGELRAIVPFHEQAWDTYRPLLGNVYNCFNLYSANICSGL